MLPPDCEKLLHLISIHGDIGVSKFHDFFEQVYSSSSYELNEDERYFARFRTIRFLEALGHCEYDYEKRRLHVCQPSIVLQSNWGIPHAILTGARTPVLLAKLRDFASRNKKNLALKEVSQPYYPVLPAAIILKASSKDILEQAAKDAGTGYQLKSSAPAALLGFGSGVEQIYNELIFNQNTGLNWLALNFSFETLSFTSKDLLNSASAIKLTEYTNRTNRRKVHFLWVNGKAAEVERDWGRFVALFLEKINVVLYNKKRFQLFVPATTPLPTLIARAITLKSGVVPTEKMINRKRYWIYSGIDPAFAAQVAEKLGQVAVKI